MAFDGNLLYIKSNGSYVPFPSHFIVAGSYNCTPRQRLELKAERNSSADLKRVTAAKFKTSISFQTTILTGSQMEAIRSLLNGAFTIVSQRKLIIKYWDMELSRYRENVPVYMPDTTYVIRDTDSTARTLLYEGTTFEFIEY
jgi:hypothetical protein